jgi:hypothetical protein
LAEGIVGLVCARIRRQSRVPMLDALPRAAPDRSDGNGSFTVIIASEGLKAIESAPAALSH